MAARRRILKASIAFISLCPAGKNLMPTLYKSTDHGFEARTICKAAADFAEKGELLAVVAAPNFVDDDGDVIDPEVIRETLHQFAANGMGVDIRHNFVALGKDQAFVAENFQIQPGDARFKDWKDDKGKAVDVTGGWGILIKIKDPVLRNKYATGEWSGVSVAGPAIVEQLTKAKTDTPNQGDLHMDAKELATLLAANNTELVKALSTGITTSLTEAGLIKAKPAAGAAAAADAPEPFKAPAYDGDNSALSIKQHGLKVQMAKALHNLDYGDTAAVNKATTAVENLQKELDKIEVDIKKAKDAKGKKANEGKSAREVELEKELADIQKGSNQPEETDDNGGEGGEEGNKTDQRMGRTKLTKEQTDLLKMGADAGDRFNQSRGYTKAKSAA